MKNKMEKESYPCPCGGKVKWRKRKVVIDGVDCGILAVEYCNKCGSEYFPEESMEIIEKKMKEEGLWGVERKEVSFWKSGGTVVVRIPAKIAHSLHLKANTKATLYPENKNKLVIEI